MREIPLARKGLLLFFTIIALAVGVVLDIFSGGKLDNWIHDAAVVFQARSEWKYTAIVALDEGVPFQVGRKQALPLFARAADVLIAAGAKGIFLDARISKELEGRMPFARCIREDGTVQWSEPDCLSTGQQQCIINNSPVGNAPLKMAGQTIALFSIAPYLGASGLPDFLLYDWDAASQIPASGLVASDRLVTHDDPIARWFDLSRDHAVLKLAGFMDADALNASLKHKRSNEICDAGRVCRRVRLSRPVFKINMTGNQLIMPVSRLASCNTKMAEQIARLAKQRVVVLQTTAPSEATDIIVTPMTTALFGPKSMTPGAQFLVNAVETLLNQDHPRAPGWGIKLILWLVVAVISVLAGAYLKQAFLWLLGAAVFLVLVALCFLNPLLQLWPVAATLAVFFTGAGQTIGAHLIIGFKEGQLISHYMPKQIHKLLLSLRSADSFQNKRCCAVVLMSDLKGYTTLTGILQEPALVLRLMNDYLGDTSLVLQDKYNGWLESYVGDMVCYYWPFQQQETLVNYKNALQGALELALLQKQFFSEVNKRYRNQIATDVLKQVSTIIDAGIGLATGEVIMGDLGPRRGVRKFGIIGDPLNLSARIESLTRLFNTEIIMTDKFLATATEMGFAFRRLGIIKVKGRMQPERLFALGHADDPRFKPSIIKAWDSWLQAVENRSIATAACPGLFAKDQQTINTWTQRNLLGDDGVWYLDEK